MNRAYPSGRLAHRGGLAGVVLAVMVVSLAAWTHATTRSTVVAAGPFAETPIISGDVVAGDNFGYAVDLDGTTLVVGAQWTTVGGKEKAGAAYVFTRSSLSATLWTEVARLTASNGAEFDQFGAAVAVFGDTIAVSATLADVNGSTNQGAVYIFERNQGGPNQWGEVKKLTMLNGGNFDNFGDALAAQGDEIFVGAKDADAGGADRRGAVYVFRRGDGWTTPQELTDPNGRQSDSFGSAVAVDGNWLVIGSERADVTGNFENDGAALLFRRTAPGAPWTYVKRLSASDADGSDSFGSSVAIRGDRVLVGAPAAEKGSAFSVGKAYVFNRSQGGADNWGEVGKLTASDGLAFDSFGISVALGSDAAYVGALQADVGLGDEGAVYIFEPGGGSWSETGQIAAGDGAPNDNFGYSVVSNDETLVVSAYLAGNGAGKVYAYTQAAPPQPSSVYLPLTFNPLFVPNGILKDGSVVTTPDGVRIGAVPGALDGDLAISIIKTAAPSDPMLPTVQVRADYYRISAAQDVVRRRESAFVLALPVPAGADTDHLAVAILGSTDSLSDMDNPDGAYWSLAPAEYDANHDEVLTVLPALTTGGQTVAIVEHPDMISNSGGSTAALAAPENGAAPDAAKFIAGCLLVACKDSLKEAVEVAAEEEYDNLVIKNGFHSPSLAGPGSDFSVDPPSIHFGSASTGYYFFIYPNNIAGCTDSNGRAAYAGQYNIVNQTVHICLAPNATSLSEFQRKVIRHEFFHAIEYSYDNVWFDWMDGNAENWIIEGMADAVVKSDNTWERSDTNPIRPVDKSLLDDSDLLEYQAEDFWVYVGRNRIIGGIKFLWRILLNGATTDDVMGVLDFEESFWFWVRNQVMEKSDDLDDALVDGTCRLENAAVTELDVWDLATSVTPTYIGSVDKLSATVVEIKFDSSWYGDPANIYVNVFPETQATPPWFDWKVYESPADGCSGRPSNLPQEYQVAANKRYFVVISNSADIRSIGWEIFLE